MLDSFEYQGRTVRDRETKTSKKQKKVGKHCLNGKNNFFYLITFVHSFQNFFVLFLKKISFGQKNIDNHWLYSFQMIKYVWNKDQGLFKQPKGKKDPKETHIIGILQKNLSKIIMMMMMKECNREERKKTN